MGGGGFLGLGGGSKGGGGQPTVIYQPVPTPKPPASNYAPGDPRTAQPKQTVSKTSEDSQTQQTGDTSASTSSSSASKKKAKMKSSLYFDEDRLGESAKKAGSVFSRLLGG